MKRPSAFSKIGRSYASWQQTRRDVSHKSNDALNRSKRAIFSVHRDDLAAASKMLKEAENLFKNCETKFKRFPSLAREGSYKAALEEYAEARLYLQYRESGRFEVLDARAMDASTYIGGLCDATGEIVRFALRRATEGNESDVEHAYKTVEMIVEFLLQLDLTGYLRNKFDQVKRNLRNLEKMMYELRLK